LETALEKRALELKGKAQPVNVLVWQAAAAPPQPTTT
jgi:hypothetical protein